jgi:hypothetical protein
MADHNSNYRMAEEQTVAVFVLKVRSWLVFAVSRLDVSGRPDASPWNHDSGQSTKKSGMNCLVPGVTEYFSSSVTPCWASKLSSIKKLPVVVFASLVRIK